MAKKFRTLPAVDYVFADGQSFKNVRDAIIAAGKTGMWHIAFNMAQQYLIQEVICLSCGGALSLGQGTYMQRSGLAIRICLRCNKDLPRNH